MKPALILITLLLAPIAAQAVTVTGAAAVAVPVSAVVTGAAGANATITTSAITPAATGTATSTAISSAIAVESSSDLAAFKAQVAAANANVIAIDTDSDNVISVTYAHHGRLFWIIPITVVSDTKVLKNADGSPTVTTALPWWHIFVSGIGNVADTVDSAVSMSTVAQSYASSDVTANAQAKVIENVVVTLNAEAGVSLLGN